ncbi:hypothetical protein BC835DRAFT_1339896 [Cytidiella melzeri]|nr:hypothetical protein BC835DRAFT_1339896 [Cytidiella melzeri]
MPTFSDGGDGLTFSTMTGLSSYSSSSDDVRFQLQTLLDTKEKQLQQAGTLGQQLLAQRMELEERIRILQDMELEGGEGDDARDKYRDLVDTIKAWDAENEQLSSTFGAKVNGSQAFPAVELSRTEIERSVERSKVSASGTTAAQSSRRAKNAAHRADDVEFAFEIGSGLLTEVRRLQSLLAERDKAIQDMKEEKDDLDKTVESLRSALRQQEQSTDKYKEENWNLEVTLQELRVQLGDSQGTAQRLEGEQKRLTKILTTTREAVDHHKNEAERHQNAFAELKSKHEADVAQARRQAASLQRDKSDLQQTLDSLKAENAKANKRLPRFGSPLTPNGASTPALNTPAGEEDDFFGTNGASTNRKKLDTSGLFPVDGFEYPDSSPEHSPSRPFLAPNHPNNEIEALQQRLAHAQRQINTLKGSLQREKELRIEYKRKLDVGLGEDDDDEEDDAAEAQQDVDEVKPRARLTPFRVGKVVRGGRGRGRGRGGMTLIQRLQAHSPGSEFADDDDLRALPESSPPPPVPSMPSAFKSDEANVAFDEEEDAPADNDLQQSPSPAPPSNRTSVDGMDPAFANILRRSTSGRTIAHGVSPLRHSVFARASRGKSLSRRSRGGAAFQEARPPSFAGEPEALASELGEFGFSTLEDTFELPESTKETVEIACQTEEGQLLPQVVIQSPSGPLVAEREPVISSRPTVSEIGIQAEPGLEPVPVRGEVSSQTDPEHTVELMEAAIQHSDFAPQREFVSTGSVTDPFPEPEPATATVSQPEPQFVAVTALVDADSQTVDIATPRRDADAQTLKVEVAETAEMQTQTSFAPVLETPVQAVQIDVPVSATATLRTFGDSVADAYVGGSNEDSTITIRPTAGVTVPNLEGDDGTRTETASVVETDMDDFVDARQSLSLATPTESMEDYHSIMTVTDNEFSSDSDAESIKASAFSSRHALVAPTVKSQGASSSSTASYIVTEPVRTYESKGVSAEFVEAEPRTSRSADVESLAPPAPLPKDFKDSSMQTDDWIPPAPAPAPALAPASMPPSPVAPSSPALFRVGPTSQQFQFISPPPSAGPTTVTLPVTATHSPNSALRDSSSSFIPRPRTAQSERRRSIESTLSSARDDAVARSRAPSNVANVVDKTRPPMMVLPPPPRLPPPSSMPPPAFIPERRQPTISSTSREGPPPRPLSPPPQELIQRATTPTFGQALNVPSTRPFGLKHHPSSVASTQGGLRQPPSTGSFRSSAAHTKGPQHSPSAASFDARNRREMSTTSLTSARQSVDSHRSSASSDRLAYDQPSQEAPATPDRTLPANRAVGGATDPTVIHAITQTMIGEFLYKYTRRAIGKGHGERRHKRFFWVHPYTRTLYWSSADPGSSNVSESSAKSAYIEGVRAVLDPNPMPPGIYQYSVVVSTPQREMKFTALTKERHDIWLNALQYLLTRPGNNNVTSPIPNGAASRFASPLSMEADLPESHDQRPTTFASPHSQRSVRTARTGVSVDSWNSTPRGQRSHSQLSMRSSMGKRSGTPAAEYLRWGNEPPHSPDKSFEHIPGQDDELDFELHEDTMSDEGFEGLENVRACCDGRHTVGRSGKIIHHHHHHDHQQHNHNHPPRQPPSRTRENHLDVHPSEVARPVSPAWSFRSRSGSTHSNDGGFFSRFGTRRSAKTITAEHR